MMTDMKTKKSSHQGGHGHHDKNSPESKALKKTNGKHPGNNHPFDPERRHGKRRRKHSQWGDVWFRLRKNKLAVIGMVLASVLILLAVFAPVLTPYSQETQDIQNQFQMPSWEHPLGTDNFGRDLLTRVLYGGRTSLLVAFMALMFSVFVAIILGAIAGYYGGMLEMVIMRMTDVIQSIPPVLLAVVVSAALGSGVWQTAIAVGIAGVAPNMRLIRGQILAVRGEEYVEAAVAIGSSNIAVMFKQILPNVLSPLIVSASMGIGGNITAISGLSFIGLGVRPPISEWGNIMTSGLEYIRRFWPMAVFPGIMIMLTLFAFNCFGDGLRDALDPKLKH